MNTTAPSLFCVPFTEVCNLISEWAVFWQALGALFTIFFGAIGLYKVYQELRRLNEQRAREAEDKETSAKLRRTEFFLSQHRRLFDNPELYSVLCLIDSDGEALRAEDMWDKKRKFLTFLEEIALLVEGGQIRQEVAFYMFGYYARCARDGQNFAVGIDLSPAHWALFYKFAESSARFAASNPNGPSELSL